MNNIFADSFCLKDGRKNFQINARAFPEDRKVYFGENKLNLSLAKDINERLTMGLPPKKFIYGLFGSGKTHTLYNLKDMLENKGDDDKKSYTMKCPIIEGEFRKKTGYSYLHGQIMEAIGLDQIKDLVSRFLQKNATEDLAILLKKRFRNANISRAIHNIGLGAQDVTLWKWLTAGTLSSSELTALSLTKNVDTTEEMVTILTSIGEMFVEENVNFILMLDELEGLKNIIDDDAQRSYHDAFRKLAGDNNTSIGFIVSIYAGQESDIPDFIFEADIVSRIGRDNIHDMKYLHDQSQLESFIKDLFELLVDKEKMDKAVENGEIPKGLKWYPLADETLGNFIDLALSAPTASIPRNIIKAINESALLALRRESRVINPEDLLPAELIFKEDF